MDCIYVQAVIEALKVLGVGIGAISLVVLLGVIAVWTGEENQGR